ncbi:uncharacterized protein LOC106672679 [Cimex lectularius]|uniref:MADF domain-containing protein n=1 Tax=Cimex lectularius TaxID=79782 RepID=A0A8I6SQG5_CIMLE|nr:uncharacterized protein LOC106672679 [Cimex lectularius]
MVSNGTKAEERKFILECIELYRSLPALWNVKCKDYNNRIKKNEQYEHLLRKYREKYPVADKSQLVKKLNSLRTNFRKELKRIKDFEQNYAGRGYIMKPTLWYFEEMKFLTSLEEQNESQNTIKLNYGYKKERKEGTNEEMKFLTSLEEQNESENTMKIEYGIKEEDEINSLGNIGTIINTFTIGSKNGPPNKKARKLDESEELISLPRKHLEQPQTYFDKIASSWAVELQKMVPQQQLFAKKAINDILFEGQMGTLRRDSVQINSSCCTSTPYNSMQPSPIS